MAARTQVWLTLTVLMLVNAFFMMANTAYHLGDGTEDGLLGVFAPVAWEGDHDGSHIEIWGHIQLFAAAVILLMLFVLNRSMVFGSWALLLFVVVVDDLFQIHEEFGEYLAWNFNFKPVLGLRPEDIGELTTWALLGLMVLPLLVVGYLKSSNWARRQSWILLGILALLAVAAIGLDMFNIILQGEVPGQMITAIALAETAGEIIPMSLFLAYTIKLAVMPGERLLVRKN